MGTNGYNLILKAPTVIQAVPHGQEEVVSLECPPAVEYAHHFKTIEELEGYCESLKYVPIQRPSENFIFTESADNYILQRESCPFCGRYFPSSMGSLDRGRHSFKICPFRPVKCGRTGRILMAKDFLYLYMWMVDGIEDDTTDNLAGVWALSSAVKRDRYTSSIPAPTPHSSRKLKTTPAPLIINDEERHIAEANARLWEDATEAIARREKLALMEMEQRALLREREVEAERLKEREARIEALEREREALDLARRERAARMIAEERIERAEESARVWEEATDVLAKRESELLRDQERLQDRLQQEHRRAREVGNQNRVIGPGSRETLERQSRTPPQKGKSGEYFRYRASSSPAQQVP